MNLIIKASKTNTTLKTGRVIKYIVIHYTAGAKSTGDSDVATAIYFARTTANASADYIVDDNSVTQFNNNIKNRYTWHCGGSKYKTKGGSLYGICTNANSIGIEMCSTNDTGKATNPNDKHWSFTDSTIANTIELVKILMKEYDIDADHVIRHYDVSGKLCPGIIGWNADSNDESKWFEFKSKLVEEELKTEEPIKVEPDNTAVKEEQKITVGDVLEAIESADEEKEVQQEIKFEETKVKKLSIFDTIFEIISSLFK